MGTSKAMTRTSEVEKRLAAIEKRLDDVEAVLIELGLAEWKRKASCGEVGDEGGSCRWIEGVQKRLVG